MCLWLLGGLGIGASAVQEGVLIKEVKSFQYYDWQFDLGYSPWTMDLNYHPNYPALKTNGNTSRKAVTVHMYLDKGSIKVGHTYQINFNIAGGGAQTGASINHYAFITDEDGNEGGILFEREGQGTFANNGMSVTVKFEKIVGQVIIAYLFMSDATTNVWTSGLYDLKIYDITPELLVKDSIDKQTEKQGGWFSQLFDKLGSWFSNLTSSISGFFTALGDRISSFFTALGDRISGFFTALGDRIKGFFTEIGDRIQGFFVKLIEDIKGLFIPRDGYFTTYVTSWNTWGREHFGFVFEIPDMFIDMCYSLFRLNVNENPYLILPEAKINFPWGVMTLWSEQRYSFEILTISPYNYIYSLYRSFIWVIFLYAYLKLCMSTWNVIVRGHENSDS